ncbi:hypothetical protein [uncultured Dysgonomonas sp.]|nr:hypothetical protein [uncultured Dysgonomonas sp.]
MFQKLSQEEVLEELLSFIVNNVAFGDLYTSGFWELVFETWVQITSANDTSFVPSLSLLVFYETGYGPYENEMQQLKGNYPLLINWTKYYFSGTESERQ